MPVNEIITTEQSKEVKEALKMMHLVKKAFSQHGFKFLGYLEVTKESVEKRNI